MGDFDDGYNNLTRPGGNNQDAFNRGLQQRSHDQAMWDMARGQQEQTSQWLQSSSQSPPPLHFPAAGAAPMTPEEARRWWIGLGIVAALIVVALLAWATIGAIDARGKAALARERAAFQEAARAAEGPRLAALLASLDPRRETRAIERYAGQSRCHAEAIGAMFRQPRSVTLCDVNAAVPGHLEYSYFKTELAQEVRQGTRAVATLARISVYPFSPYNLARLRQGGRTLEMSTEDAARMLRLAALPVVRPGRDCAAVAIYRSATIEASDGRFDSTVGEGGRLPIRVGCFENGRFVLVG